MGIQNLFSFDSSDKDLCNAFQSDFSVDSLIFNPKRNMSDIFSISLDDTPQRTSSDFQISESYCSQNPNYSVDTQIAPNVIADPATGECKIKREIIDLSNRRFTGCLKFYN